MNAGFAQADITPAVPCRLNGFIARSKPAESVDLPLRVRALWVNDDRNAAVLLALDALGITDHFAEQLIADLAATLQIPPAGVIVHYSHTHSAPMTVPLRGLGPVDQAYLDEVRRRAIGAAAQAKQSADPVRMSWASHPVQIGINRRQSLPGGGTILGRNPDGPCDREVRVLQFAGPRQRILLFSHACHPLCIGAQFSVLSPDFFGHAAAILEAEGHQAIYLNGCAGDINPQRAGESPAAAREEGQRLGAAMLAAVQNARPVNADAVIARTRRLALPFQALPPLPELEASLSATDRTVRDQDRAQATVRQQIQAAGRQWLDDLRRQTASGRALPPAMTRLSTLRLGPLALLALPSEVFYQTGQDIAAQLGAEFSLVAAYCFGYVGYICPPDAYDQGGYEPDESHRYVSFWKLSRQATDTLAETTTGLWNQVQAATR